MEEIEIEYDMKLLIGESPKEVIVRDYSDFCPTQCFTGGHYSYTTIYQKVGEKYEILHKTSADFAYCKIHGSFQDCEYCPAFDGQCNGQAETITKEQLEGIILNELNDDRVEIIVDGIVVKSATKHFKTEYCSRCGWRD